MLAVDKKEEELEKVKNYVTASQVLNTTSKEALAESGIKSCQTVVVCIGNPQSASFLTVLNLKELNIPNIIAKAHTQEQGRILEKIGADRVIYPEKESAARLANQLVSSDILEFLEVSLDYQVTEVPAPQNFWSKTLKELNLQETYHLVILALRRKGTVLGIPAPKESVEKGDVVVLVGRTEDMRKFAKKFEVGKKK